MDRSCGLTEPEAGPYLAHVNEEVDEGDVHEDVAEKHHEDVGGVGVLTD